MPAVDDGFLDDASTLAARDPSGMLRLAAGLGDQLARGFGIGRTTTVLPSAEGLQAVVVCGMGGSGISGDILRDVFRLCPRAQWVHTRSAGLDNLLFPELVESPVPLTNGTGVFSASLGEFALAAILYFAIELIFP